MREKCTKVDVKNENFTVKLRITPDQGDETARDSKLLFPNKLH